MHRELFINSFIEKYPNASKEVLTFIANFAFSGSTSRNKTIIDLFINGYCYYFALMLKDAFGGEMVADVENHHILWKDTREGDGYGLLYDVCGIYKSNDHCIPVHDLYESLESYRHRGKDHDLSLCIQKYKEEQDLNSAELNEKVFSIIPKGHSIYPYPNEEDTMRYFGKLFSQKSDILSA